LGGKVGSYVTRNTSDVVEGADPGSKLVEARRLGINIMKETKFLEELRKAEGKP
jgi:DNA ligase (NAD+)